MLNVSIMSPTTSKMQGWQI